MSPLGRRVMLTTGDAASLVLFTVIGLINHEDGVTVGRVAQVVLPEVPVRSTP